MGFLALILALLATSQSFACRDPLSENHTFFNKLPSELNSKAIVVKIKIIFTEKNKSQERHTAAKVVSAINGYLKEGATVKIVSDTGSCNRDPDIRVNQEYYIAGDIGADGIFRGTWAQRELEEKK